MRFYKDHEKEFNPPSYLDFHDEYGAMHFMHITTFGKNAKCMRCNHEGHNVSQCPLFFCFGCGHMCQKNSHNCTIKKFNPKNDMNQVIKNTTKDSSPSFSDILKVNSEKNKNYNNSERSNNFRDSYEKPTLSVNITNLEDFSLSNNSSTNATSIVTGYANKLASDSYAGNMVKLVKNNAKNRSPPSIEKKPSKEKKKDADKSPRVFNKNNFFSSPIRSDFIDNLPPKVSPIKSSFLDEVSFPKLSKDVPRTGKSPQNIHTAESTEKSVDKMSFDDSKSLDINSSSYQENPLVSKIMKHKHENNEEEIKELRTTKQSQQLDRVSVSSESQTREMKTSVLEIVLGDSIPKADDLLDSRINFSHHSDPPLNETADCLSKIENNRKSLG